MAARSESGKSDKQPLKVVAPLVLVTTDEGAVEYLRFGDVVGDNVSAESLKHLKSLGYVSDGSYDKNDK